MPKAKAMSFAVWYKSWIANQQNKPLEAIQDWQHRIQSAKATELNFKKQAVSEYDDARRYQELMKYANYEHQDILRYRREIRKIKKEHEHNKRLPVITAAKAYKQLISHPEITNVIIEDRQLKIATKPIYPNIYDDDSEEYDNDFPSLGRFNIQIDPNINYLRIYNLNWIAMNVLDHPHIKDGIPCFGNYQTGIRQYFTHCQLFLFINSIIRYLTDGYKENDSFCNMQEFFDERQPRE